MKLSDKLDALREMARMCVGEPHKLYLIGLLAEHAEEGEVDEGLPRWPFGWRGCFLFSQRGCFLFSQPVEIYHFLCYTALPKILYREG